MMAAPAHELLPPKLRDLLFRRGPNGGAVYVPSRYKVAYGGRGGTKSWSYANVASALSAQRPLRILCVRELQNSIKESMTCPGRARLMTEVRDPASTKAPSVPPGLFETDQLLRK